MNTKKTFIIIGGVALVALVSFVFYPSYSKAGSGNYQFQRNLSVGAHKSDAEIISESYERILASYIGSVETRLAVTDQGLDKLSGKLDTIEKKIDGLDARLERIEKALIAPEDIPKPKLPPSELN